MVKAICYTLAAIVLCISLFIFAEIYVNTQFEEFGAALEVLYDKVEDHTASREDGYAVRALWNGKKESLHILLPHNDISYVDYWLNETCGLIYNGDYDAALAKIEVLREIAINLPDAYKLRTENIL